MMASPPRQRAFSEVRASVSFTLPLSLIEMIGRVASENRTSRSEIVKRAIQKAYVTDQNGEEVRAS